MLRTRFTELLGLELPIVQAGMGSIARAELAAAVSDAGGLGTIALVQLPPAAARAEVRRARERTRRPVAVNFLLPFLDPDALGAVLDAGARVVTFFWGDAAPWIGRVHGAGAHAMVQVGSADEAARAVDAGADVVIAQGVEAGGHVRGTTSTLALVPLVVDRVAPVPVLAAGGIADARGIVAALAAGADGAVLGTRFIATPEVAAHARYRDAIVDASPEDTVLTTLFDAGWPGAPHRVLRTCTVTAWEEAGQPRSGARSGEHEVVGTARAFGLELPLLRYGPVPPLAEAEGDVDALAFYAGQSCGLVRSVEPAGEIVRRLGIEAAALIRGRLAAMVV